MKAYEVKHKVEEILSELLELQGREPLEQEDLSGLGLDSLRSVNLVVELEVIFNIVFEDEELLFENFSTVGKITDRVRGKLVLNS